MLKKNVLFVVVRIINLLGVLITKQKNVVVINLKQKYNMTNLKHN
ncbi:uncharacterized protein METZ01_LOCUS301649 [marine metagenome]|uniref:Uncharacterized protein n=1 Tax=marine metagenome TaxID=408172 RepID=A0A382ML07_9ZZZZ